MSELVSQSMKDKLFIEEPHCPKMSISVSNYEIFVHFPSLVKKVSECYEGVSKSVRQ